MGSQPTDIIFIQDLRAVAVIGIYEWERRIHQTLHIDLELATDIRQAAASDGIEDTLNYKAISKRVIGFVQESRFDLIETLTERLAETLLAEFAIPRIKLTLHKPGAVRGARDVGVVIERNRED